METGPGHTARPDAALVGMIAPQKRRPPPWKTAGPATRSSSFPSVGGRKVSLAAEWSLARGHFSGFRNDATRSNIDYNSIGGKQSSPAAIGREGRGRMAGGPLSRDFTENAAYSTDIVAMPESGMVTLISITPALASQGGSTPLIRLGATGE